MVPQNETIFEDAFDSVAASYSSLAAPGELKTYTQDAQGIISEDFNILCVRKPEQKNYQKIKLREEK